MHTSSIYPSLSPHLHTSPRATASSSHPGLSLPIAALLLPFDPPPPSSSAHDELKDHLLPQGSILLLFLPPPITAKYPCEAECLIPSSRSPPSVLFPLLSLFLSQPGWYKSRKNHKFSRYAPLCLDICGSQDLADGAIPVRLARKKKNREEGTWISFSSIFLLARNWYWVLKVTLWFAGYECSEAKAE
jgi:hypothetical protein